MSTEISGKEPQLVGGSFAHPGKRRLSLRRLGTMLNVLPPDAVALDALIEMIHSEEFFVRYNAAKLLGKRADRDARRIVETVLETGDSRSRASVVRHLYGFTWFSSEPLLRRALQDSDHRVREAGVYALCDLRQMNAYQLLTETLVDETDDVLAAAAFGLRETQDRAALPILKLVLKAEDPEVRIKALEALGLSGLHEAMPIVREAMFDPEPEVKYAATLSLLELAGESWLQELAGVIGRTKGETLKQVLRAFFHATNYLKIDVGRSTSAELMLDALESALLDNDGEVRMAAIWPLAWMRHERTANVLRKSYRIEVDAEVKAHIVRVSASLMSAAAEDILKDALSSEVDVVREAAEKIQKHRECAGDAAAIYDENAYSGEAFERSHLTGRLE